MRLYRVYISFIAFVAHRYLYRVYILARCLSRGAPIYIDVPRQYIDVARPNILTCAPPNIWARPSQYNIASRGSSIYNRASPQRLLGVVESYNRVPRVAPRSLSVAHPPQYIERASP